MKYSCVPLGGLVTISGGGTPSRNNDAYWGGSIPWATVKDLKDTSLSDTQESITPEGLKNSASNLIPAGSVIVATRMGLGKVAINTIDVSINQDLKAFTCSADLDPRYLMYYLLVNASHLDSMGKGATVKGITLDVLKDLSVPLPPLPEQKRIAAILDKADSIRRKRQEAVWLTEELLRSVFLDMFGDPVTNPKGWEVKQLCELVNFTTGKLDSNAAVTGGAYPFFTCSRDDLQIDTFAFDCEALLLAGNNASADYSVKHYKGKFNAYQRTYVITMASPSLSYRYMQYALEMKLLDMKRLSKGTNTKYLTLGILDELPFQVPDKSTQSKFEKIVNKLNITASKLRLAESVTNKTFNSLLQDAFKGELYP